MGKKMESTDIACILYAFAWREEECISLEREIVVGTVEGSVRES